MGSCRWCGKRVRKTRLYCSDSCKAVYFKTKASKIIMDDPVKHMEELPEGIPNNRFCNEVIYTKLVEKHGLRIRRQDLNPLRLHPGDVVECLIRSLTRKTAPEEIITTKEITLGTSFDITPTDLVPLDRKLGDTVEVFIHVTFRNPTQELILMSDIKSQICENPRKPIKPRNRTEYMRLYQRLRRDALKKGTWNKS